MTQRHNLVRDPAGVLLTDWFASASVGSPTISAVSGTGPVGLATFARVTATGSATYFGARIGNTGAMPVTPGQSYTLSAYLRPTTAATVQSQLVIRYLDAGGSQTAAFVSTAAALPQTVFTRASVSGAAPVGSVRAEVFIRATGSIISADRVEISAALLEQGTLGVFFYPDDGVTVFDGTAYASASTFYAPDLTVTPALDANPCPRVEVLITDISPGVPVVDVYRLAAGREYKMRGGVQAAVSGALTRIDFEIPFGVPVTYRAEMFDSDGVSLGFTETVTVQLDVAETWVHNPLDPQGATTVAFWETAARSLTRPSDGEVVYPLGRSVGVIVAGQRHGLVGAVLDIVVDSVDQADRVQNMLGGYDRRAVPVICFRIGSNDRVRLPRPLFAGILTLSENDLTYVLGGDQITFGMTGDEVAPPTPALIVPLLTRADLNAFYPSRAALNAAYLTRLDANRDYAKAGTA